MPLFCELWKERLQIIYSFYQFAHFIILVTHSKYYGLIPAFYACYDEQGERVDFCSAESFVASAGSKLREAPAGFDGPRELKLSTSACHSIVAYVYVVTNTEPVSNVIADSPPFDLKVKVRVGRKTLYNTVHKVSQWHHDGRNI